MDVKQQMVRQMWMDYRKIIPPNSPEAQFRECKRAFYAGAKAMMKLLVEVERLAPNEDMAVLAMATIDKELNMFANDVLIGRE